MWEKCLTTDFLTFKCDFLTFDFSILNLLNLLNDLFSQLFHYYPIFPIISLLVLLKAQNSNYSEIKKVIIIFQF